MLDDLRYALRILRKSPVFAVTAILTLALGIGANTAIFSVVNGVLLRPLPYREPDRIVTILHDGWGPVSAPDFLDWQAQSHSFEQLSAAEAWGGTLTDGDHPESVPGLRLGTGMFELLGVPASLGRTFRPDDYEPGHEHVLVLSDRLWRRRFGASQSVVGQTVRLDSQAYTVIGVMPPEFQFAPFWSTKSEMWGPLALADRVSTRDS